MDSRSSRGKESQRCAAGLAAGRISERPRKSWVIRRSGTIAARGDALVGD